MNNKSDPRTSLRRCKTCLQLFTLAENTTYDKLPYYEHTELGKIGTLGGFAECPYEYAIWLATSWTTWAFYTYEAKE